MLRKFIANTFFKLKHSGIMPICRELKETEFYSQTQIADYQNNKLKLLIKHSYNNVPYYKELFDKNGIRPEDIKTVDDLKLIPILEKSDIQNNFDELLSNNIKKTFSRTTTGSTGMPLKIIYDKKNKLIEIALGERFVSSICKPIGSKRIVLWGRVDESYKGKLRQLFKKVIYNNHYKNVYRLDNQDYFNIAKELKRKPDVYLTGYANPIYMLACKSRDNNTIININSVSVTAEKLYKHQRELIEKHLTKNLYNMYGCGEINSIAYECNKHNGLHHAFEHSILEIVNEEATTASKEGAVVITNLDNYAMPLIRYRNGDLIKLSDKTCTCGRSGLLIESIEGRLYDFIEGENKSKVHSAFLDHILDNSDLFNEYKVKEVRIIQTKKNELVVQYVSDFEIPLESFQFFQNIIIKRLGKMNFIYSRKKSIPTTKTGKRKFVIPLNEYNKNPSIYDINNKL